MSAVARMRASIKLPHKFGTGSPDDRDAHASDVLQVFADLRVSGDIDDQIDWSHFQKLR